MRCLALTLTILCLAGTVPYPSGAQGDSTTATLAAISPRDEAVAFLRRVEEKNAATETLRGRFTQTRIDETFLEEVTSEGEFRYKAPSRFRADYRGRDETTAASVIYMVDDRLYNYVPEIKQVDVLDLPKGDSAAINQMLLGFGVKVEKILDYFEVQPSTEPAPEGRTRLNFFSKNREKTLGFDRIEIVFVTEALIPETLYLFEEGSETTIALRDVAVNEPVDDAVFEAKFPKDVEIIQRGQGTGLAPRVRE